LRAAASARAVIRKAGIQSKFYMPIIFACLFMQQNIGITVQEHAIARPGGVAIRSLLTVSSPLRRKDGGQALQAGL
jgi:hypothetical protein